MAPVVIARLPTTSPEVREQYSKRLLNICQYSIENEPGVHKYAVFIPQDETDTKSVWVLEEYATQEVFDTHMASPIVKQMIDWMSSGNILDGAPEFYMLDWFPDLQFTKPEVKSLSNPYIVFANLKYHPGKRDESIPIWTRVVKESEAESGTFVYGVLQGKDDPDKLYTLEVYESKEYLWEEHVGKNGAVKENMEKTKEWRESVKLNQLKMVGGFLSK